MWKVPLWLIFFFVIIYVLGFFLNYKRKDDLRKRNILSLLPRLYFLTIYLTFWALDIETEICSIWGRYGILAILVVDSFDEFEELWEIDWKYKFEKIKINLKRKWKKIK